MANTFWPVPRRARTHHVPHILRPLRYLKGIGEVSPDAMRAAQLGDGATVQRIAREAYASRLAH